MSPWWTLIERVKLIECPRDAWQGLPGIIPTAVKVAYLRALIAAGFKHLDAVSFVSPKAVPQMADSEEVLRELDPPDDVEIIGIVANERGMERAINSETVTVVGFPYSVSETFLKNNVHQTLEEAIDTLEKIKQDADSVGMGVAAYISMAFGNPYGDAWNADEVVEAVRLLSDMGIETISLADTVGLADVDCIEEVVSAVIPQFSGIEIGVHLHGRREHAAEKVLAAFDAGCRRFDSAIGGLGGCPFAQDLLVGNIPTEIVLQALESREADLPVRKPLDSVLKMNSEIASKHAAPVQ
ncbi:MAG TPA: hydroxymethylglutaryl-CoA lyase [Terriglobales bacterium]|nr:hydroxymethylglutaryl-CoA lyase [Terriglobales bacterium]